MQKVNIEYKPYYKYKDFDYHVHIGQYFEKYFAPHKVIEILKENGIKGCMFSSTTSCIKWHNEEEKLYLLKHIEDEVKEALLASEKLNFCGKALYWVIVKSHSDGKSIEDIMLSNLYSGFKIHTKQSGWENICDKYLDNLFDEICDYANRYNMPILIHCGVDEVDSPKRFEKFFGKYSEAKFILAHLRPIDDIVEIMNKYENVYADTAFADEKSIFTFQKIGEKDRLLYGTDFPVNLKDYYCKFCF